MPAKCHHVRLNACQRDELKSLIASGTSPSRKLTRARILLKADAGALGPAYTDKQIQEALEVSLRTIQRTRYAFALEGLQAALNPKERRGAGMPKKFDGQTEAHLIALACSDPPEGAARWTLRLLAEKIVELQHVSSVCHETIRRVVKKTNLSLG